MSTQIIDITKPAEEGAAKVTVTPTDEDGTVISFAQLTDPAWQLMITDPAGVSTIVNENSFANNPLSSLVFGLTGEDLAMFGVNDTGWRTLAFQATYDSDDLGADTPLKGECTFEICKLLNVVDQ